jgi:hypothetical protein
VDPAAVGGRVTLLKRLVWGACLGLCLGLLPAPPALPQELIVNADVGVARLDEQTLRAIFGMRLRRWSNGEAIRVFVLPDDNPDHVAFAKQILNTYPHQLRRAWDRLVYSGTGQAPVEVTSTEEMRERVRQTPGAIGYVPDGESGGGIHVLEIEK